MRLRSRLLLMLVLLGWVPLALFAYFSDSKTRVSIVENAERHLGQVRDLKAGQIENYLLKVSTQARVLSRSPLLLDEMKQLPTDFAQLTAEAAFQHYVYENPHAMDELNNLEDAGDGSEYSRRHRRIHRFFDQYVDDFRLHDLLLIDVLGNVIYSVGKEPDFASNLEEMGEYRAELMGVYRKALESEESNRAYLSRISPYFPSDLELAGFVASPIDDESGNRLGVVVMQYSMEPITHIVNDREGLHEGAKVLLMQQRGEDEFLFLNETGMSWEQLVELEKFHRKAYWSRDRNAPMIQALLGSSGVQRAMTPHGKVFAAWRPVTSLQWGLVVRIHEKVLLHEANQDRQAMMVLLVVLLLLILVVSWRQSSALITPILQLLKNAQKIENQNFEVKLDTARSDELGDLNRAFVKMGEGLRQASRAKDDFVASMSHELRTPLTIIIGNCEFLTELEQDVEKQRLLHTIEVSGRSQLALVNDILDMSKIESGKFNIDNAPFNLNTLLSDIERMFAVKVRDKGLHFDIEQDHSFSHKVVGDGQRIGQVLINLLSNAVKFTEEGSVSLRASIEDKRELRFSVKDSGIGMSSEVMERLFHRFEQADNSISRRFGGTGLGLYISKILVELMDGYIEVSSEEEVGTEFVVVLPYRKGEPIASRDYRRLTEEPHSILSDEFEGKVLVAEDTPELQLLERRILESLGVEVTVAHNGGEAVESAMAQPFDLIFMDMQMPILSGIEATEVLRENGCETPIVALTANVMQKHRDAFDRAGCDGFLEKPINKQDLVQVLKKHLDRKQAQMKADALVDEELMAIFRTGISNNREKLQQALQRKEWSEIKGVAHVIKGSATSFGYPQLTEQASAVCTACELEQFEQIPVLVVELLRVMEPLLSSKA